MRKLVPLPAFSFVIIFGRSSNQPGRLFYESPAMTGTLPDCVKSYDDASRWIYERIDYERVPPVRASPHFQLDRVRRQLALIGSPQDRIPAVHIAGTKGKGSTAAIVDSILRASGIRTGLFTSPHIRLFEERMKVDGHPPNPHELTALVADLQAVLETADEDLKRDPPTYFEVATLLAWMYFDRQQSEMVVLETGLGGRLDSTNVCSPRVTVITNISLDHTSILGDTIEQVAAEKAGIIKDGVPLVLGAHQPTVVDLCETTAASLESPVIRLGRDVHVNVQESTRSGQIICISTADTRHDNLSLPLIGSHQAANAALAVSAVDVLSADDPRITTSSIATGLAQTEWPLRFEVASEAPMVILDAAHNPAAVSAVIQTLNNGQWPERPRVLVFGASRDKDVRGMLQVLIPEFDHVVMTRFRQSPRSCPEGELQQLASEMGRSGVISVSDSDSALNEARQLAGERGLVCVTGSVFLAAECRGHLIQ